MKININGKEILIDEVDKFLISSYSWKIDENNCIKRSTKIKGEYKNIRLSRRILERKLGRELNINEEPDHIDRDRLNNQRDNLRVSNHQQNMANIAKYSYKRKETSKYKGVSYDRRYISRPWRMRFYINGQTFLEYFSTEVGAAIYYNKISKKYHGEFAFQNKIEN